MKNIGTLLWRLIEVIAHFFLNLLFKIIGKELTEEKFEAFMQFIKFGLVGVSNTLVNYLVYYPVLIVLNKAEVLKNGNYLIAQVAAFIVSVFWSFMLNSKFVFTLEEGEERSFWKALLKTYISSSFTGLFLSSVLLILWVQVFGISEYIAPILNLVISVPINFFINKFWAFKKEA